MQPADRSRQRKHRSTNQEQLKHLVLILLTHPTSHTPPCSLANTWAFLVKQFSKEETYFSFIIIWGLVLAKCAASFALWAYRLQEITEWPFALLSLDWLSPRLRPRPEKDEHPPTTYGTSTHPLREEEARTPRLQGQNNTRRSTLTPKISIVLVPVTSVCVKRFRNWYKTTGRSTQFMPSNLFRTWHCLILHSGSLY